MDMPPGILSVQEVAGFLSLADMWYEVKYLPVSQQQQLPPQAVTDSVVSCGG